MGRSALIPEIAEITNTTMDKGVFTLSQASNNHIINSLPPQAFCLWIAKSHWRIMQVHILAVHEMPALSVTQSRLSYSPAGTPREMFAGCYLKGFAEKSHF